jgi:hypothetical protein
MSVIEDAAYLSFCPVLYKLLLLTVFPSYFLIGKGLGIELTSLNFLLNGWFLIRLHIVIGTIWYNTGSSDSKYAFNVYDIE